MNRWTLLSIFAVAGLATAPTSAALARPHSTTIEPYRGIAGVRIGMKLTDVVRVLGRPTWHDAEQLRYDDLDLVVRVAARDNLHPRRVRTIVATIPPLANGKPSSNYIHYRDPHGLGLGSTRGAVAAVYPKRDCPDSNHCTVRARRNADGLCGGYDFQFAWLKGQGSPVSRDPVQTIVIGRC